MIIPTEANTHFATFTIRVDGTDLPETVGVQQVIVQKETNKIPTARITVYDGDVGSSDFVLSAGDLFKPGNTLEILGGYEREETLLFTGIIITHSIAIKGSESSTLNVELRDAAVKMTVGRKNRYFAPDSTDSDIIEELLGEYADLQPEVEATDAVHQEMVQYFATDWDFMLSRAEVNGQLVFVDDGLVAVKKPAVDESPLITLNYGQNILEFEAAIDARDQLAATRTRAWDYATQELAETEGSDPGIDGAGNLAPDELAEVVGLEEWVLQHPGLLPGQELQAWSDATLMRSRLAKVRGRVKVIGYSEVKPGQMIELAGFGDRFNGNVFVSGVYHEFSPSNKWYTNIQFGLDRKWFAHRYDDILEKPAAGLLPAIQGLHQGVVTNIHEDPDGEGRVQVNIPIINPEDPGVWARVARPDAGEGERARGVFFHPEIGDEVVVGFFNDDPRDPVILGMLHSSAKPTPYEVTEDNHEKGIVTRGELKFTFNDDTKVITLETPNGNKVVLSDEDGGVTLEDENGNTCILNSDGITLDSAADVTISASGDITLSGTNVSQTANAEWKAEGSAGVELSSSATATLKGSLVQIN